MNSSEMSPDVLKKPFSYYDNGVYLWVIVGVSLGAAIIITVLITLIIYYHRRRMKQKNADLLNPSYLPGQDLFCPSNMISSFSSSASDLGSETSSTTGGHATKCAEGRHFRRPLGPSTSLDPPSLLRLTASECHVQPRPTLTRWHTVASPQTTAVPATLPNRDSDEDDSPPCLHGRIWFSLLYKPEESKLQVTLHRARYLPGRGLVNTPRDPFVKIFLLPDEENFQQSKIRKRTLSPKFNETFEFTVSSDDLTTRNLKMSVYDVDKKKVRHSLGHILLGLKDALVNGESIWRDLEIIAQSMSSPGELQISLSCNPYSNRIKATVCKARCLQGLPQTDLVAYAKVDLYHGRRIVKSKRTTPLTLDTRVTSELIFDESFSFGVSGRFFDSCSLEFTLVLGDGSLHGKVVVGPFMYARGETLRHWQEMLANPRTSVVRWHVLEPPK